MADILRCIGVVIYVITTLVDRFIYPLPDELYIPLAILGILCLFAGMIIARRKN